MALTEIDAPNSLPTVQQDYVDQNNLIAASLLDPHKIFPIDFDNDEIPQGTILNVGGTILKAVTAESITGTRSNFVKIDATAYTASYVSSLSGVTWNSAYNGYYDSSSPANLYLFDELEAFQDEEISSKKLLVSRYVLSGIINIAGITFNKLSTGFSLSVGAPALAGLDSNSIAFIDATINQLRTYSYDGFDISQDGSGLSISGVSSPSITALDSSTIAFIDTGNDQLRTYSWNGSTWSLVGSGLTITTMGIPSITALDSSTIAFIDDTNDQLRTYSWNGSTWSLVGSGLSLSSVSSPSITALDSSTIAYFDTTNKELRTYSWNGSTWSLVGSGLSLSAISTRSIISFLSNNTIVFADGSAETFRLFKWDGSNWSQIQIPFEIDGMANPAIGVINNYDFFYLDAGTDKMYLYRRITP